MEIIISKMILDGYMNPKWREKAKLCYIETYSLIVCIIPWGIYGNIAKDFDTRFHT